MPVYQSALWIIRDCDVTSGHTTGVVRAHTAMPSGSTSRPPAEGGPYSPLACVPAEFQRACPNSGRRSKSRSATSRFDIWFSGGCIWWSKQVAKPPGLEYDKRM